MSFNFIDVWDGEFEPRINVYTDGKLIGFIAWRWDHPRPAWYFQGELCLGLMSDGGCHFWWLALHEDHKGTAIWKFKRRFYAAFGGYQ